MVARPKSTEGKSNASKASAAGTPYTVLARRYRSRDFDELIGQEPIARTLLNAIKSGRTAHAYLFCGTRGVGKTSMARIFAKALNATDDLSQKEVIGNAILRGDDLDVIEIDAASNRGIDNARDLIAGASLSPARSPYKVYIIDEVHQLTKEAFNALLKTMEEPPSHVKFILCTTEAHKVPATIQSRCQRFDFRPIPSPKIAEQLRHILKEEGVKADDAVVAQIARLGNGSMRDALSLMDRLLAAGEEKLTPQLLEQMLGLPDHALIEQLVEAFIAGDASNAIERGERLMATGATVEQALELLTEHLRTLMIIAACGEQTQVLDLSDEARDSAAAQAKHFDSAGLVHMVAICDGVARSARNSAAGRALFDAAMVRLALSRHFADISTLLEGKALAAPSVRAAPAQLEGKKKDPDVIDASERPSSQRTWGFHPEITPPSVPASVLTEVKDVAPPVVVADDQLWPRTLELASQSIADRVRTEHLVFESFDGRVLKLSVDEGGADIARFLAGNVDKIVELVRRATHRTVTVQLDTSRFEAAQMPTHISAGSIDPRQFPVVEQAMQLFGASIVSVRELEIP